MNIMKIPNPSFFLWFLTRGLICISTLVLAGLSATLLGRVPMVLNDVLLWSIRVYSCTLTDPIVRPETRKINSNKEPEVGVFDHPPEVGVFDHPTFFDHAVLMKHFGRPLRFLAKMKHFKIWPLSVLARSFKCVGSSYDSLAQAILDTRSLRSLGLDSLDSLDSLESTIFVAPDPNFTKKPFKTGAFRVTDRVLPVVLHYEPTFVDQEDVFELAATFVSNRQPTFYAIRVMTPISKNEDETVDAYSRRVQAAMDSERELARKDLETLREKDHYWTSHYGGSLMLTVTSTLCFFLPALFGFAGPWARLAMVVQGAASIWYHSTGRRDALWWDKWIRNILGPIFVLIDAARGNLLPLYCAAFAGLQFASGVFNEIEHALLVHLPVMIGFFLYGL